MEFLEDQVDTPEDELKRADHLVYVSLKYTRTCDIMKNAIKRMIAAYELSINEYLENIRKNKKIKEVPTNFKEKVALVKSLIGSSVNKYLLLYNLLKRIDKAEYTAIEELSKIKDEDIETVAEQAGVSKEKAREALEKCSGDLAEAILSLKE